MNIELNSCQQEAYEKILAFLVSDEKYFILSGKPGYGKSTLINYIANDGILDKTHKILRALGSDKGYGSVYVCATTNSAADNLQNCSTIHSRLKLIPRSGVLQQVSDASLKGHVVILDEYTLVDYELFKYLESGTSKVILVGDRDQLLAVKGLAYALQDREPDHELTIPMRTEKQDILSITNTFRNIVRNVGITEAIDTSVCDNVFHLTEEEFQNLITDPNHNFNNSRIITHTNQIAININQAIRKARGYPDHFVPGETISNNSYRRQGSAGYNTDSEYVVLEHYLTAVSTVDSDSILSVCTMDTEIDTYKVMDTYGATHVLHHYPQDPRKKNLGWYTLFDLRSQYCSTIYKAQGRSFDDVYIDLGGFANNISRSALARSLYVGVSRARNKVFFIGELSQKLLDKL